MKDKTDLLIKLIQDQKESTDHRLDSIDENLRQHMRRTEILESLHNDNQKRIELLERPKLFIEQLKYIALWIAAISGCILTILKLIDTL